MLSIENWKRPKDEIETRLMTIFDSYGQELSEKGVKLKLLELENLSNDI